MREAIGGAIRARLLERTIDSGQWPCDFAGAQSVKLQVPTAEQKAVQETLTSKPGVRAAEAELDTGEIQDLADNISTLKTTATTAGCTVKFRIVVELSGKEMLPDHIIEKMNKALLEISPKLQLR